MTTCQVLATSCCLAILIFNGQSLSANDELTGCLKNGRLARLQRGDEPISSCRGRSEQVTIASPAGDDGTTRFRIYGLVAEGAAGFFPVDGFRFALVCRNPEITAEIQTDNSAGLELDSQGGFAYIRSDLEHSTRVLLTDDPGDADWSSRHQLQRSLEDR
jgi:hypothetical protein